MRTFQKTLSDLHSALSEDADYVDVSVPIVSSLSTSANNGAPASSDPAAGGAFAAENITYTGSGLVFHNTYGAGVSAAFHDCIIAAENFFQSHFTNAVTINMNFDLKSMSSAFSAQNNFYNVATVSYATLKSALQAHETTADDIAAVNSLPSADPSNGQGFHVTAGMARILGLEGASSSLDDDVALNSALSWSYGQDAIGALEHEISEGAMGRVGGLGVQNGWWAPMDLFRYSSAGQHDYTGGKDGLATYFSVDGTHLLTQFHNSLNTSGVFDQQDFADWGFTTGDAFGPGGPGSPGTVSDVDLRVMDILGWTPPSVPPQVNVHDVSVAENQSIAASSLITSVSNPSGDNITYYGFWDGGSGNGHFSLNGANQPDGQWIVVSASNLSSLQYVGGSSPGSETLYVDAYDATTGTWSASSSLSATTTGLVKVVGTPGNDIFSARGGNKLFDGNGGHDTLVFDGPSNQFAIVNNHDGSLTVTDTVAGRDGTDQLVHIEFLQFSNKDIFVENSDNANIARLYSAALGRAPDTGGLSGWEDAYSHNVSAAAKAQGVYVALAQTPINGLSIAGGFTHSPEFQQKYGPLTDTQYVTQLYQNVLGRGPDAAGLNGWLDAMHHGTTREVVLVGFAESPENVAKTAADWLIQV